MCGPGLGFASTQQYRKRDKMEERALQLGESLGRLNSAIRRNGENV
jgi:hypothetical protein